MNCRRSAGEKTARLRALLSSPELTFLMEAHSAISAKIAEEVGFEAIWASGLTMTASMCLRDNNEATWTQILDVLELMVDATDVPILADGDSGHGNFNNVRRFVRKLCERGVAGVCIEDKLFPKMNSLIGQNQPLADVDEFCGRIKAGKDAQSFGEFSIIARTEAFVSGLGLGEALRRAEAYRAAGADGILVHSKAPSADEVVAFCKEWSCRCPVLVVPTTYPATPTQTFRDMRVSMVIWANHSLRAAVAAMRQACRLVMQRQSTAFIDGGIATIQDLFSLVDYDELIEAEARYAARTSPCERK
jgi:phosphoenolpyruvate phosphomutase